MPSFCSSATLKGCCRFSTFLSLAFALLLAEISPTFAVPPSTPQATRLRITNGCGNEPLWVAHEEVTGVGPDPQNVKIEPLESYDFKVFDGLSGTRYWAKMRCNSDGNECEIGESGGPNEQCNSKAGCAPPVDTKFEASFGQNGMDWVDISLVDGWTLPFKFEMKGDCAAGIGTREATKVIDCSQLSFDLCPASEALGEAGSDVDLRLVHPDSKQVVGCYSPCSKLTLGQWASSAADVRSPQEASVAPYCCPTPPETPDACRKGPVEATQYVRAVHQGCPGVYGYSYDDGMGLLQCPSDTSYEVTFFCPDSRQGAAPKPPPPILPAAAPVLTVPPTPHVYKLAYQDQSCDSSPSVFDNCCPGETAGFDTRAKCEAMCDKHENCHFLLWGYNPSGYYRCAGYETCDKRSAYGDGDPNVFIKAQETAYVPLSTSVMPMPLITEGPTLTPPSATAPLILIPTASAALRVPPTAEPSIRPTAVPQTHAAVLVDIPETSRTEAAPRHNTTEIQPFGIGTEALASHPAPVTSANRTETALRHSGTGLKPLLAQTALALASHPTPVGRSGYKLSAPVVFQGHETSTIELPVQPSECHARQFRFSADVIPSGIGPRWIISYDGPHQTGGFGIGILEGAMHCSFMDSSIQGGLVPTGQMTAVTADWDGEFFRCAANGSEVGRARVAGVLPCHSHVWIGGDQRNAGQHWFSGAMRNISFRVSAEAPVKERGGGTAFQRLVHMILGRSDAREAAFSETHLRLGEARQGMLLPVLGAALAAVAIALAFRRRGPRTHVQTTRVEPTGSEEGSAWTSLPRMLQRPSQGYHEVGVLSTSPMNDSDGLCLEAGSFGNARC